MTSVIIHSSETFIRILTRIRNTSFSQIMKENVLTNGFGVKSVIFLIKQGCEWTHWTWDVTLDGCVLHNFLLSHWIQLDRKEICFNKRHNLILNKYEINSPISNSGMKTEAVMGRPWQWAERWNWELDGKIEALFIIRSSSSASRLDSSLSSFFLLSTVLHSYNGHSASPFPS